MACDQCCALYGSVNGDPAGIDCHAGCPMVIHTGRARYLLFFLALAVFSLVTPTFLLTRGSARWYGFLKNLNLYVIGVLVIAGTVSLFLGTPNLVWTVAVGLLSSLVAGWLYRTDTHAECVEYCRIIWEYRRQHL